MHNRNPYNENYKTLMKDIKKLTLKERINRFICGVTKILKNGSPLQNCTLVQCQLSRNYSGLEQF